MELESRYGVQPSYTPAINQVLAFMKHVSNKISTYNFSYQKLIIITLKMPNLDSYGRRREVVFMLLSIDGSLRSQMVSLMLE